MNISSAGSSYNSKISQLEINTDDFLNMNTFCNKVKFCNLTINFFDNRKERKIKINQILGVITSCSSLALLVLLFPFLSFLKPSR